MQQYGKAGMVGGQGVPSPAARPGGPAQGSAVPVRPGVPTVRRVLQCVAVCCSVSQFVLRASPLRLGIPAVRHVVQDVADVLQCVAT